MAKISSQALSFFGVLQRIYTIFASSTKRWQLLKKHLPSLSLKPVCDTRWESKIVSVKAVRYQTSDVQNALLELTETTDDPETKIEAASLAEHELGQFEFLVSLVK